MKFLYLFAILFLQIAPTQAQGLDLDIYDNIHQHRNTSLDGTMNGLSLSVYPLAAAVPLVQWIYGYANRDLKSMENGFQTATALVLTAGVTYGLKKIVDRNRPYIDHPQYKPYEWDESPSFPSGHVSFAFATATSLSLQYKNWYVITPAYLWAGAVGYSRVHLGAHYPSDVLMGAVVGAGASVISYKANQWLRKKWGNKLKGRFGVE